VHDASQIEALVHTFRDAWNRGDGAGYASVFADDADFTSIRLDRAHSRDEIAAGHEHIFSTIYRGTRLEAEVEQIRFVRPDVAVANVDSRLLGPDGEPFGPGHAHAQAVVAKDAGRWQIVAFQNMIPVGAAKAS
jgi:uncharacterized protein (TIGR02246 family)